MGVRNDWRVNGAKGLAAAFEQGAAQTQALMTVVVEKSAADLTALTQQNASGRPGPNAPTGDFRGSWRVETVDGDPTTVSRSVGTDRAQANRLEYGFVGTDSLGRCVDDQTEILTTAGWRTHDHLDESSVVLTLNPDTWVMEWNPVQAVHRYLGEHKVQVIEARTLSAATTDNHRWLVERYYPRGKTWIREWRTTATMPANARIPLPQGPAVGPERATVPDDVVELAAWFWTEGSYGWSMQTPTGGTQRERTQRPINITISQSEWVNPLKTQRIRDLLTRLLGEPGPYSQGCHWNERLNEHSGSVSFRIDRVGCWLMEQCADAPDKALRADWLVKLTPAQLDLLIEVSLLADGHVDANGVTKLTQGKEARIRSWEMACVLAGRPVVTRFDNHKGADRWSTTLLRTKHSHAFGAALRTDRNTAEVVYETRDFVWCPQVENGTWVARRNGTVYVTGNSYDQPPYPHHGPAVDVIDPIFELAMDKVVDQAVRW